MTPNEMIDLYDSLRDKRDRAFSVAAWYLNMQRAREADNPYLQSIVGQMVLANPYMLELLHEHALEDDAEYRRQREAA